MSGENESQTTVLINVSSNEEEENMGPTNGMTNESSKQSQVDSDGFPTILHQSGLSRENTISPSLQSLSIGEIVEIPELENLSISAVLHYCKCKILRPYLRVLAVIGLKSLSDRAEQNACVMFLNYVYSTNVILLIILGYFLQYMACFRRDRGFCFNFDPSGLAEFKLNEDGSSAALSEQQLKLSREGNLCYGSLVFAYITPDLLHLVSYVYTIYLFRMNNNEQLQSMMERVFLLSSSRFDGAANQKRLLKTLWMFILCSFVWLFLSFVTVNLMVDERSIVFQWMQRYSTPALVIVMKILLVFCTLIHDIVQVTIITSYCLECQLLKCHLFFLKIKLLQQFITPLQWMREITEFQKLLNYLNSEMAPAVCFLTVINLSWALSGTLWLLRFDTVTTQDPVYLANVINVFLWIIITVFPFVQAARLTAGCQKAQMMGHELRIRPIAHQNTPSSELDSVLLFASSLRLSAKLFKVPITGRTLCVLATASIVFLITLGQCHVLQP